MFGYAVPPWRLQVRSLDDPLSDTIASLDVTIGCSSSDLAWSCLSSHQMVCHQLVWHHLVCHHLWALVMVATWRHLRWWANWEYCLYKVIISVGLPPCSPFWSSMWSRVIRPWSQGCTVYCPPVVSQEHGCVDPQDEPAEVLGCFWWTCLCLWGYCVWTWTSCGCSVTGSVVWIWTWGFSYSCDGRSYSLICAGDYCAFCAGAGEGSLFFGRPSGIFAGVLTDVNLCKCFLFLIAILLEPIHITLYCRCSVRRGSHLHANLIVLDGCPASSEWGHSPQLQEVVAPRYAGSVCHVGLLILGPVPALSNQPPTSTLPGNVRSWWCEVLAWLVWSSSVVSQEVSWEVIALYLGLTWSSAEEALSPT